MSPAPKPVRVARVELAAVEPAGVPGEASAVVQVLLDDGREFSILAATPSWFASALDKSGLRYYFGPSILFLKTIDLALARKAVGEMSVDADRWFCRYDTPRKTLPAVLDEFRAKQAG